MPAVPLEAPVPEAALQQVAPPEANLQQVAPEDALKDSEIWRIVPGRVLLISCYTHDAVDRNVVVTVSPATAQ